VSLKVDQSSVPTLHDSSPNTGDKPRSSIACAGFVCFIPLFPGSVIPSEILWLQARVLRYASEHLRTQQSLS
jgi:hypothetical protein